MEDFSFEQNNQEYGFNTSNESDDNSQRDYIIQGESKKQQNKSNKSEDQPFNFKENQKLEKSEFNFGGEQENYQNINNQSLNFKHKDSLNDQNQIQYLQQQQQDQDQQENEQVEINTNMYIDQSEQYNDDRNNNNINNLSLNFNENNNLSIIGNQQNNSYKQNQIEQQQQQQQQQEDEGQLNEFDQDQEDIYNEAKQQNEVLGQSQFQFQNLQQQPQQNQYLEESNFQDNQISNSNFKESINNNMGISNFNNGQQDSNYEELQIQNELYHQNSSQQQNSKNVINQSITFMPNSNYNDVQSNELNSRQSDYQINQQQQQNQMQMSEFQFQQSNQIKNSNSSNNNDKIIIPFKSFQLPQSSLKKSRNTQQDQGIFSMLGQEEIDNNEQPNNEQMLGDIQDAKQEQVQEQNKFNTTFVSQTGQSTFRKRQKNNTTGRANTNRNNTFTETGIKKNQNQPLFFAKRIKNFLSSDHYPIQVFYKQMIEEKQYQYQEFLEWLEKPEQMLKEIWHFEEVYSLRERENEKNRFFKKVLKHASINVYRNYMLNQIIRSGETNHRQTKDNANIKKDALLSTIGSFCRAVNDVKKLNGIFADKKKQQDMKNNSALNQTLKQKKIEKQENKQKQKQVNQEKINLGDDFGNIIVNQQVNILSNDIQIQSMSHTHNEESIQSQLQQQLQNQKNQVQIKNEIDNQSQNYIIGSDEQQQIQEKIEDVEDNFNNIENLENNQMESHNNEPQFQQQIQIQQNFMDNQESELFPNHFDQQSFNI